MKIVSGGFWWQLSSCQVVSETNRRGMRIFLRTMETQRQLAAILFADIQGSTALMQRNEKEASGFLRRFEKAMRETVPSHNGRIANFYGDGALCLFNATLDAMHCSMKLHSIFQLDPPVPVRIGIHSGTIVT